MAAKKQVEKDLAKILFISEHLCQKEISERIFVTEKTISKWIKEGLWESLKVSLLVTKDNQLNALYAQLESINHEIQNRAIIRDIPSWLLKPIKLKNAHGDEYIEFPKFNPEDYPIKIGNVASSKDADIISKITTAIKKLETETSIGEIVEVSKQLIQFTASQDSEFANKLTRYCDAFISSKMKK
jgi:putative lipoic acid-binding regulatory protein